MPIFFNADAALRNKSLVTLRTLVQTPLLPAYYPEQLASSCTDSKSSPTPPQSIVHWSTFPEEAFSLQRRVLLSSGDLLVEGFSQMPDQTVVFKESDIHVHVSSSLLKATSTISSSSCISDLTALEYKANSLPDKGVY